MKNGLLWAGLTLSLVSAGSSAEAATTAEERARIWGIAKLVLEPGSEASLATICAGVSDPNPDVRAAAARVSRAMGAKGAIAELRQALAGEQQAAAAVELLAALAELDDTSGSDEVLAASVMSASQQDLVPRLFALVVARGRRMSALWPQMKAILETHSVTVARGLKAGFHQSIATLFASYALRDRLDDLYDVLLFSPGLEVDAGAVTTGFASPAGGIRSSAYMAAAHRDLPVPEPPPASERATLCERASRHLFEAARGFARSEPLSALMAALATDATARKCMLLRFSDAPDSIRGLTPEERGILLRGIEADKDAVERAVKKAFERGPVPTSPAVRANRMAPLQTISDHRPDFVQAVLEGTRCRGRDRSFDGVDIVYAEGGRIRSVVSLKSGSSAEGCADAVRVLGLTSYENDGFTQATKIVPERPEFLACLVEEDPPQGSGGAPAAGVRVGRNIQEPKKVRNVAPRYPESARNARAEGSVILEALIRPSGCLGGVTVLRGVHPLLDLEAINAVAGWRYTPTLLNGVAVPVLMTVTVNFRIN